MADVLEKDFISPQASLRKAFSMFPTGVVAICAMEGNTPVGMAVNSFSSVSLEPALVAVCVANTSTTWPRLATARRLGLSVLGADQEMVSRRLSSRTNDRFENVPWEANGHGAVFVNGATLWLDCSIHDCLRGGDHEIILLEVQTAQLFPEIAPLVFHQSQYLGLLATP